MMSYTIEGRDALGKRIEMTTGRHDHPSLAVARERIALARAGLGLEVEGRVDIVRSDWKRWENQ